MSCQLVTVGKHRLCTENIEILARQLSDIFGINIDYGVWEHGPVVWGSIVNAEGRIRYWLEDLQLEDGTIKYSLEKPVGSKELLNGDIFLLDIYREIVQIGIDKWPYRGADYCNFFFKEEPCPAKLVLMETFRRRLKEEYGRFGTSKVYCFGGGYSVTGFLEDKLFLPWDEFENYILSGKYLDDTEEQAVYNWKEDAKIINVSDYISGVNPTRCNGSADIFVDDFKDL